MSKPIIANNLGYNQGVFAEFCRLGEIKTVSEDRIELAVQSYIEKGSRSG